jgi:hypothetical protein
LLGVYHHYERGNEALNALGFIGAHHEVALTRIKLNREKKYTRKKGEVMKRYHVEIEKAERLTRKHDPKTLPVEEPPLSSWRPIETAPKDGSAFLGWWIEENKVLHTHWLDNSKTAWPWAGWRAPSMQVSHPNAKPTHWMPLPEPPK